MRRLTLTKTQFERFESFLANGKSVVWLARRCGTSPAEVIRAMTVFKVKRRKAVAA